MRLDIPACKEVNYIINLLKRVSSELKLMKNKIDKLIDKLSYESIKLVRSWPGIIDRLKIASERKLFLPCYNH